MGLPASYRSASLRCVLPMDAAAPRAAFALNFDNGDVVRVHLSPADMRWLVSTLRDEWPQGLEALCACRLVNVTVTVPGEPQEVS